MQLEIEELSDQNKLIAGTRWYWDEEVSDYPATTHKLKFQLKKQTESTQSFETSADGSAHQVDVAAATTAVFKSGFVILTVSAINLTTATDIRPIRQTIIEVLPDPATASDARSFEAKMVDKLEVTILALATKTMDSISIEGRSYNYTDIEKLERLRNFYANKAGLGTSGRQRILTKFTNQ